jgi:hypothetical protein
MAEPSQFCDEPAAWFSHSVVSTDEPSSVDLNELFGPYLWLFVV